MLYLSTPQFRLYCCSLPESSGKRESERFAEQRLVAEAFGEGSVLSHRSDGAPFVEGVDKPISVSHSATTVVLAVSESAVIGVDIEKVSARIERVAHKILTAEQLGEADALSGGVKTRALMRCWCIKEAVFKAEGETAGLMGEHVSVSPAAVAETADKIVIDSCLYSYQIFEIPIAEDATQVCVVALQQARRKADVRCLLERQRQSGKKVFALLLDPDKCDAVQLAKVTDYCRQAPPTLILVGGSTTNVSTDEFVRSLLLKDLHLPIVLFPGSAKQVTSRADAILLLSLISGREAELLIGQHVKAARWLRHSGLQVLPTGYILVEGGRQSAVERVSHTAPISQAEAGLIVDTAMAGEMLGYEMIYLEAGSGALTPVSSEIIAATRAEISRCLIVGGGICTVEQMTAAFDAGADIVVVGNYLEQHIEQLPAFVSAAERYNSTHCL